MTLRPQTKTPLPETGGKTPLPSGNLDAVATPKRVSLTPLQEANLQVRRLLAPQYAQASQEAARQQAAAKSFTQAIISRLQGVPSQVQGDYQAAIGQQANLANAAADSLRSANPYSSDVNLAATAPEEQKQQFGSQLANTFNGGAAVGQYLNGVSPLGALRSQGLAATELARLQPSFQALRGSQAFQGLLAQQADVRAKIASQQPGLVQNWLDSFRSNKAKQAQLALENQALGLKTQNQSFNQNLSLSKLQQQQNQFVSRQRQQIALYNSKQATAEAKLGLPSASLSRAKGFLVDSKGNAIPGPDGKKQVLPGYTMIRNGHIVKTSSLKSANKPFADLTKTQVAHLRADANMLRFGTSVTGDNPVKVGGRTYVKGDTINPVPYGAAIAYLVSRGYSRKSAVAMLNNFYPPGKQGRAAKPTPDRGFRDAKLK